MLQIMKLAVIIQALSAIAQHLLRPQDKAILTELHPDDYKLLKNNFHYDKRMGVHLQDAYQVSSLPTSREPWFNFN